MKNYDKLLLVCSLLVCVGGGAAFFLLGDTSASRAKRAVPSGTEVPAWTDKAKQPAVEMWKAPEIDVAEGWNYDLFSSPEISWDSAQKKYFAKDLPPPPEEIFGVKLKSLAHPKFRIVVNSYAAGTKPVPTEIEGRAGHYAAVLTLSLLDDASGKTRQIPKILNFGSSEIPQIELLNAIDPATNLGTVTLLPKEPITIPNAAAKLKSFTIRKAKLPSGAFSETYQAVVIDESGKTPREFVIGNVPVDDKDRTEAIFTDGNDEWLYRETRIRGKKTPTYEICVRNKDGAFTFLKPGREFQVGGDSFRIKNLDISAQEARIEKQSSELDKKTKAPKITERVLSPERQ